MTRSPYLLLFVGMNYNAERFASARGRDRMMSCSSLLPPATPSNHALPFSFSERAVQDRWVVGLTKTPRRGTVVWPGRGA